MASRWHIGSTAQTTPILSENSEQAEVLKLLALNNTLFRNATYGIVVGVARQWHSLLQVQKHGEYGQRTLDSVALMSASGNSGLHARKVDSERRGPTPEAYESNSPSNQFYHLDEFARLQQQHVTPHAQTPPTGLGPVPTRWKDIPEESLFFQVETLLSNTKQTDTIVWQRHHHEQSTPTRVHVYFNPAELVASKNYVLAAYDKQAYNHQRLSLRQLPYGRTEMCYYNPLMAYYTCEHPTSHIRERGSQFDLAPMTAVNSDTQKNIYNTTEIVSPHLYVHVVAQSALMLNFAC